MYFHLIQLCLHYMNDRRCKMSYSFPNCSWLVLSLFQIDRWYRYIVADALKSWIQCQGTIDQFSSICLWGSHQAFHSPSSLVTFNVSQLFHWSILLLHSQWSVTALLSNCSIHNSSLLWNYSFQKHHLPSLGVLPRFKGSQISSTTHSHIQLHFRISS